MSKLQLFILTIVLSFVALLIWHADTPLFNSLNWDMYEHQTLINELRDGHFAFLTSQISDTFTVNSYPPFFHLILAGLQVITRLSPLSFWFVAEKIFFFLTVFASLWLGWVVTKDKWAAFFSGMLGAFVFESFMAYTSLFLMPQTLCALVFVFALTRLLHKRLFDFWQILLMVVILFLHYIVGAVAAGVLFFVVVFVAAVPWTAHFEFNGRAMRPQLQLNYIVFGLLMSILAILLFNPYLSFNPFQTSESIYFNLNLAQKVEIIEQWYGFSFPILGVLGVWGIWKRGKRVEKVILVVNLFLLGLVLVPFPYVVKFYVLARYLLHVVFATGLSWVLGLLSPKWLKVTAAVFFCTIFVLIFIGNQQSFKSILRYHEITTHTTSYDSEAAKFLKENYGGQTGVLLVSEPATQGILEGLSGVNTQGGVYMNEKTRRIVDSVYPTQDTLFIRNALYQVEDGLARNETNKVLLALSGRFFAWQEKSETEKMDTSFNIWQPQDLNYKAQEYIDWLKEQKGFECVFENEGAAIFAVMKP